MKAKIFVLIIIAMLMNNIKLQAQSVSKKKILVVYFSHSGNTRVIAEQIKKATNGDIFEVQPVKDYPDDYNSVVDQAKKEINANYKSALKTQVKNIKTYDVIFVGSPCWWGTIAPPVATFLSSYDLSGKTIVPFMTHEGSGMGHSVSDIKKLCPKSTVLDGLPVRGSSVKRAQKDVIKWLREIKMIK
jgi:flavodoxin